MYSSGVGADQAAPVSPELAIGIPGAVLALLTMLAYFVGLIRPIAVRQPRYRQVEGGTEFSCKIKNRSPIYDRTVTGIAIVRLPSRFDRLFSPWRSLDQSAEVLPWGVQVAQAARDGIAISKRDELSISGELRGPGGSSGVADPEPIVPAAAMRIQAFAGKRRSRSRRFKSAR